MKNAINLLIVVTVLIAAMFVIGAIYVVPETQQVVITQFGMPIGEPVTSAGLHLKLPFIQHAHFFDKRLLEWDGDPNQIPTRDKKYIWVDTIARWKINDALKFLQSVGTETGAQARLDDIINSASRDIISSHDLVETIRDTNRILESEKEEDSMAIAEEALEKIRFGREELEKEILETSAVLAPQYGIDIVDVRIKRINYVQDVRLKVYQRMISERKRAAEQYRSEGKGKSAEIRGQKEKELKAITSGAYKTSQGIVGKADAEAISIYAGAYNNDPEFYAFLKTLETYEKTIDGDTTILLTTDGDYYKYLKKMQ